MGGGADDVEVGAPGGGARADAQGVAAEEHGALAVRWVGADVSELWWPDYQDRPLALAIRRWAQGTILDWAGTLWDFGKFAAHWPELSPSDALSQCIVRGAAMGQQVGTIKGVISAVHMAEKLKCIPPTVSLSSGSWHAGQGPLQPRLGRRRSRQSLSPLRHMAAVVRTSEGWITLAFTALSFAVLLKVGEASSCRPCDLTARCALAFFNDNRADDLRTTRLGAWVDEWRCALAAHPIVARHPPQVPFVGAPYVPQDSL